MLTPKLGTQGPGSALAKDKLEKALPMATGRAPCQMEATPHQQLLGAQDLSPTPETYCDSFVMVPGSRKDVWQNFGDYVL